MSDFFPVKTQCAVVVEGERAISTLPFHLSSLGIVNPIRIEKASLGANIRKLLRGKKEEMQDSDGLIVIGGEKELRTARSAMDEKKLRIIFAPSGTLRGNELISFRERVDCIIIDPSLTSSMKRSGIRGMMTFILYISLATLTEGYHPLILAQTRFLLSRAHRIRSLLSSSPREASHLASTLLPITADLAFNGAHSSLIALMNHIAIDPYTPADSAGTLLLPLTRFIQEKEPSVFSLVNECIEGEDLSSWVSFWKEGITDVEKEATLTRIILSLDELFSSSPSERKLREFLPYLRGENL